jgi:hypothetical protein
MKFTPMIERYWTAGASRSLLVTFALTILLVYALLFYPGAMGFDVAYQWWQSRGGETTNIHGIGMTWLWHLENLITTGPGLLFVLQLTLLLTGAVLIADSLPVRQVWKLFFLLATIGAPVCFVQFSAVGSDTMLTAALCCAFGMMVVAARGARASAVLVALSVLLLFFALLLRKNALLAVFPLLVYAIHITRKSRSHSSTLRSGLAISIPLVALMQVGSWMLESHVDRRVAIFPATAMWDLAAMSIHANEVLLPPSTYGPGMTVEDLSQALVPYANTTLFEKTHAGMRQPFFDPDDPMNGQIRDAWIGSIIRFPEYYLSHRWQVTRLLFGSKPAEWPGELVYYAGEYQYRDNPIVIGNTTKLHQWFVGLFEALRSTWALAAYPYLVIALAALAMAWRRRQLPGAQAALVACASGLMYAMPLPLISPSAELRYLSWTCLSSILGIALALSSCYSGTARTSRKLGPIPR